MQLKAHCPHSVPVFTSTHSVSFMPGVPFPKNFQQVCKKMLSRLFRVFVHVYIHHFDSICSMGAEAHINTCYKHYYYFISEFNLIDHSELEPLVRAWCECFVTQNMILITKKKEKEKGGFIIIYL